MKSENSSPETSRPSLLRNWLSLSGLVVVVGSLFSFLFLFMLEAFARTSNPYVGILTYFVAPAFLMFGLLLAFVGVLRERRKHLKAGTTIPRLAVDLSRPRDRRIMGAFLAGSVLFLLVSALGSYHTYHFTESVEFCGEACHTVMKPELVTYRHGSHARVACTECHIGRGATWFVKSKLSGTYQVYATLFDKYPRPVPTPIKNLRPAQETCEQCHWPQKFVGNVERTFNYFLPDQTNTPFSLRLLMKVGGGDPTHGPVGGIHWHMNVGNRVEYIATDEARQKIPWVRVTDGQGGVKVFTTKGFTNDISQYAIRSMDCMDCHNRPAHRYKAPNDAVDLSMSLGRIDRTLPWIKTNAVFALTQEYATEAEAMQGIATHLTKAYPDEPRIRPVIGEVQQIYRDNMFPEMKASWKSYPDNIGHMYWPGCFRCHDGQHSTQDGKHSIQSSDCNACHTILAQGSGKELEQNTVQGATFAHPGDPLEPNTACHDCHTGAL